MAKKKHRPTSPSANRQRSVVQQKDRPLNVSSSSVAKPQTEFTTTQKTSDAPLVAAEERRNENVTLKQEKRSSSGSSATSAAERRRKRVTSQRTSSIARSAPSAGEKRRRAVRKSWWERNSFVLIGGIVLVVLIAVGVFVIMANSQGQRVGKGVVGPSDPKILQKVTTVQPSVFANVKTGGIQNVLHSPAGNPPLLTGIGGKPKIFFYGAEFCPYCAAERWSVAVALSRFGTFTQLPLTVSADPSTEPLLPDIPTFSFVNAKYSSDYVDFDSLEALGRSRETLQTASAAQQKLLTQYKVGGFPFIDIADKYTASGQIFDPALLKELSQQEIANMLSDPTRDVTQKIIGAANYFTAAICSATDNKPADVCTSDPIPELRKILSASPVASLSSGSPLSVAMENCPGAPAICRRRGDTLL